MRQLLNRIRDFDRRRPSFPGEHFIVAAVGSSLLKSARRRRGVGRALAMAGLETVVSEAQNTVGQGVSSRNSEVIHAGLYYAPGSLKARLCVRGKELLYALCASHGVPHRNCGKLVVANSDAQALALRALQRRAQDNGVPVQFIGYPLAGHSPTDPVHQKDVDRRWVEWIEKHFKKE